MIGTPSDSECRPRSMAPPDIKGVEAQALLKVRLDKVAEIINRVWATIDRNPEIVGPLGTAARELEGTVEDRDPLQRYAGL